MIFLLGWWDAGLLKVAELVVLAALEVVLNGRYSVELRRAKAAQGINFPVEKPRKFEELLAHMVEQDGLTDDKLPFSKKYGGSFLPPLVRKKPYRHGDRPKPQMNLADIRNTLAHGARLDGLPWSGLQELVRDLIEYSFRIYLAEHHR